MIKKLAKLFAEYKIYPKKFRAIIHLHKYHSENLQKRFWSKVTNISQRQFNKSFMKLPAVLRGIFSARQIKQNTGKRKRDNYQGCLAISYYDAKLVKKLKAIYREFAQKIMGV